MFLTKRNNSALPNLLDEFFNPDWMGGVTQPSFVPAVNIKEVDDAFTLELIIPGYSKDEVSIAVDQHTLTITGEITADTKKEDENFTQQEFVKKPFKRNFRLPKTINDEKIEATFTNGILHLNLPKREEALPKPKRVITIG